MDFEGKVAVVTGGASGIGRAAALAFAEAGADVVVADLNETRMAEAVEEIGSHGRRAAGIRTDVTQDASVEDLARESVRRMGRVDLIFNNAGVVVAGPPEAVPMEDWQWITQVNLLGPVRGARAFLPHFLERGSGYIVNTASFAGLVAHNPLSIPYDMTKHGVVGLSAGLALYCRPRGIGVSVLCPGYVETNLGENTRLSGVQPGRADGPQAVPDRVVTPPEVAARVVAAVREDRFLILSQDEHLRIVQKRWQDIDRHIARQLEHIAAATSAD